MPPGFRKSFTLIELLVVIAITGLIVAIVVTTIFGAQARARDAKRESELSVLKKSLEFYYIDKNKYPTTTDWISLEDESNPETQAFSQAMKPNYLSTIPGDPLYPQEYESGKKYSYRYIATTTDSYELYAKREKGGYLKISSELGTIAYTGETPEGAITVTDSFGSWAGGTWSGTDRGRGNAFYVVTTKTLTEIQLYINPASAGDLYFFVYEGLALTETYNLKCSKTVAASTGESYYSSGPMNCLLEASKYYLIGVWWGAQSVTYGRGGYCSC